ncbi:Cof-type HAD-IIB family hydrolase [Ruminiclostridium herbifermentans]|uniref:Cof-type HAD-IIB family hydrolase n=1 Tax=Ruminiclostridium herbifermentans TaxID=2488810 RepID=A0A4U7JJ52_9FIRM|nr:Cof-type HAD-IIB family hydrolase [Ruminiclostridium herbifermentans]QNU68590.1 Cof-type HAD-IIB family hydrolase [Ruminiclostridium herbifermentans]
MSNRIRLLGLDLDGTLLDNEKLLSKVNEDSIKEAMNKGVVVVPITGRPKSGIPDAILQLFHSSYIITSNGAVTTDIKAQRDIDGVYLKNQTVIEVFSEIQKINEKVEFEVFVDGIGYAQKQHFYNISEKYRGTPLESYIKNSRSPVDDIISFIASRENDITGISIMTESTFIKNRILNVLTEFHNIKITSSIPTDLEINAANAGKGLALLRLANSLGIQKSQIMACGDSENDIEMLEMAEIGVAMGNADEKVKLIADYITLSNEEDGVAHAINRFISCQPPLILTP